MNFAISLFTNEKVRKNQIFKLLLKNHRIVFYLSIEMILKDIVFEKNLNIFKLKFTPQ